MNNYRCKECQSPDVTVTRNEDRYTLPKFHVICTSCDTERDVNITQPPASNSPAYV